MNPSILRPILSVAHDASTRGAGGSLRDLLVSTQYRDVRQELSETEIANALRHERAVIDEWLRYSEDKRTSGGWYFVENQTHWVVGRLRPAAADRFTTPEAACAAFIVRELDFWAELL